jgi:hypothetical protein
MWLLVAVVVSMIVLAVLNRYSIPSGAVPR